MTLTMILIMTVNVIVIALVVSFTTVITVMMMS